MKSGGDARAVAEGLAIDEDARHRILGHAPVDRHGPELLGHECDVGEPVEEARLAARERPSQPAHGDDEEPAASG